MMGGRTSLQVCDHKLLLVTQVLGMRHVTSL